jgi:hypothetical protein
MDNSADAPPEDDLRISILGPLEVRSVRWVADSKGRFSRSSSSCSATWYRWIGSPTRCGEAISRRAM